MIQLFGEYLTQTKYLKIQIKKNPLLPFTKKEITIKRCVKHVHIRSFSGP